MFFTKPLNILRIALAFLVTLVVVNRPTTLYCGDWGLGFLHDLNLAFVIGIPSIILLIISKVIILVRNKKNKNSQIFVTVSIIFEILSWSALIPFFKALYCLDSIFSIELLNFIP